MHLNHISRPKSSTGLPQYLHHNAVLPYFYIKPIDEENIEISVLLPYDHKSYSWFKTKLTHEEFMVFYDNYINKPEQTLEEYFKWQNNPNRFNREILPPPKTYTPKPIVKMKVQPLPKNDDEVIDLNFDDD